MTAVLVTGGAGFVGSHACKALSRAGFIPVTYDDLSNGHREAVRFGPLETGDIRDGARIAAVLAQYRPAAVLHFAARIEAGESVRHPALFHDINVNGSRSLLTAMQTQGIRHCVFSSTAAVYGNPVTPLIAEDHPLEPVNPYGATKLEVERMLAATADLRFVALRYFNAAGADPECELGECHEPETHLIPLVLQAAAGKRPQVEIYGTDYDTPDGTCIRDYIHVSDLADAHVLALRRLLAGSDSQCLNLGTGQGYSVQQIIATAGSVTGRPVPVRHAGRRAGDPARLIADPARAAARLGWRPQRSEISALIGDAWRWLSTR